MHVYVKKQILLTMDLYKSPWKSASISDPILSLSNSHRTEQKQQPGDRYCLQNINKNLFLFDNNDEIHHQSRSHELQPKLENSQEKNRNYRGLLVRTCSFESEKKCKDYSVLDYVSKIRRPGYILHDDINDKQLVPKPRTFPKQPYRILNAPKLKDDFYTSLLDWSSQDIVSVVLDNAAYIWNSKQSETQKLIEGFISSIKWGKGLIIGQQTGRLRLVDVQKKRQVSKHRSHNGRIGAIDSLGNLVATGSKDCSVLIWDIRSKEVVHRWQAHKQEVCGVKWSFQGNMIASGGNDNIVSVYDVRTNKFICKFNQHTAAVKALAWNPHQNSILSTGGGSTDKTIRVWNISQNRCIKKIDTGSQVCNMMYSINSNQLVSTHGFSMNAISIWNGKDMQKIGTLRGHSYRVLYLARSPDGESILTGSGDQTLRFWKIFPSCSGIYNRVSSLEAKNTFLR